MSTKMTSLPLVALVRFSLPGPEASGPLGNPRPIHKSVLEHVMEKANVKQKGK